MFQQENKQYPNRLKSDELLKASDIARILNVSRSFAYQLMRSDIPTVRLGRAVRVRPQDLEDFIYRSTSSFPSNQRDLAK